MSLLLAKNNAPAYDYYSQGDGLDPVQASVVLDGSSSPPSVVGSSASPVYLVAEDDTGDIGGYNTIVISTLNEEADIDWELSLNNADWSNSIAPSDMDVSGGDQTLLIYARCSVLNDGTILTGNKIQADFRITANETPN